MARKNRNVFVEVARDRDASKVELLSRKADEWREILSKLVKLSEFKSWMFWVVDQLCAFEPELVDTTEFGRGVRAAGTMMKRELMKADESVDFMSELYKRHYEKIYSSIRNNKITEKGDRR